jgi:flagellar M-ring protein FliF
MAAEEAAAPVPPASPFAQVQENIRNLSQRQKLAAGAALAFGIALIVGVLLWSRQPDYSVLFSNLAEKDGGAVVASLQQQNIPYKFSENGNAILVPATQVHDLRLRLAAQGIPKGGLVGFELMETQKLGLSQFHEQVNYQRALEGELSRTISSIASVAGARVHLAIPKQTAFLRDEQKPTASVMVNLHTGRSLDQAQIAGIVHLISSSVPNLSNDNVSVIDQDGSLLTKKPDPLRTSLDATQIKYTRELEEGYIGRINAILTPLFGKGNFRAQVSADVDFNQTEQTAETYRPNPSPEQAIRSQQSNESQTRDQGPQGVPGALSNQPPVPATAPLTTPAVPGTAGADGQLPLTTSKSATINYEVDKTIQHTRKALGQIKRLSVAVAINHKEEKDKNGNCQDRPVDRRRAQAGRRPRPRSGRLQQGQGRHHQRREQRLRGLRQGQLRDSDLERSGQRRPVQGTHQVSGHRRRDRVRRLRGDPAADEAGHAAPARSEKDEDDWPPRPDGPTGKKAKKATKARTRTAPRWPCRPKLPPASPTMKNSPRCTRSPRTTRAWSPT